MASLTIYNLYDDEVYQKCVARINSLSADATPEWGSMSAAQMMAHCSEIFEVTNGKALKNTPFMVRLLKGMIKNIVLNDKPYKKNAQTHPQYKQDDQKDFETEKAHLLAVIAEFVKMDKDTAVNLKHPLFGKMTLEERGWSMYKHLDHHLVQFGV